MQLLILSAELQVYITNNNSILCYSILIKDDQHFTFLKIQMFHDS